MYAIILFDGICNFCNQSVQFIIKRDPTGYFYFTSLQSNLGQELLTKYGINKDINSFILIENDRFYTKSTAALRVCWRLRGVWKILFIFLIIPSPIRNFFYNILAKHRYKWFGKMESCMIPPPEIRKRFLE